MSGILEQILVLLQSNNEAINRLAMNMSGTYVSSDVPKQLTPDAPMQAGSLGVTTPTVSADQLTALIMPHISNETIKTALGAAMRALGVNNLPEAQPHQYAPLFASFQQVLAAHGVGGPGGGAGPTNTASSII